MSIRQGPPKHQNKFAWIPNVYNKHSISLSVENILLRKTISYLRRYGKYKSPAKWHWVDVDVGCAKEQSVCAKCHCCVDRIVGRDSSEVEAKQKLLDEVAIKIV
ncbi:uncharacterized protein LOC115984931 [Quercus lobata]|uniref:uncharacterized protein LOC115984931 n=1 Tax=Quercus lobata TaxID=97700 RepID=UPI001245A2A5|nr:uncharacterized protein LOC115984931 [Quercus lobata]